MKSVTTILSRLFPFNPNIPKYVLERAKERGTAVHEWIDAYNRYQMGEGDFPIIPIEYQAYADNYIKWFEEYDVKIIHTELKMTSEKYGITGILDLVCSTKNNPMELVSIKSTYKIDKPYCELQESAYNTLLLENGYIDDKLPAYVVHLSKKGYKYVELEDQWELYHSLIKLDAYLDGRK